MLTPSAKVPAGVAVPSVLRGFSAPVKLENKDADPQQALRTMAQYDTDGFNRSPRARGATRSQ